MKQMLRNFLRKIFYQKYYNWWDSLHRNLLNDSEVRLTEKEKSEVDRFHRRFTNLRLGYTFYETSKALDKFDINYIQDTLYFSYILRHLNPYELSKAFSNKSFYGFYFQSFRAHLNQSEKSITYGMIPKITIFLKKTPFN